MKIDTEKLNPTAKRMAEAALEQQRHYERLVNMRKTMTLQEIADELQISKQRVSQILNGGPK